MAESLGASPEQARNSAVALVRDLPVDDQRQRDVLLSVRNVGQTMLAVSSKCVRLPRALAQNKVKQLFSGEQGYQDTHSLPLNRSVLSMILLRCHPTSPPLPMDPPDGVLRRAT